MSRRFTILLSVSLTWCNLCSGQPLEQVSRTSVKNLEFMDPASGMVQYTAPFPDGWRFDNNPNDQLFMTGPEQTVIYGSNSGQFIFSNDPFARESAMRAGGQVMTPMPVEQYLQYQLSPYMQQRGYRMKQQYPLPEVLNFWELFGAAMPQGLSRRFFSVVGADWEGSDGSMACTVLVMSVFQQSTYTTWNVQVNELYASQSEFETAKSAYLYAAANMKMNPNWQIAKNRQLMQQIQRDRQISNEYMRQSRIQHISRMNAILARGETRSSIAKINSDILDISHSGYLKRSDMVSAGQARTVNMISEQSVITNPNTGELYQVQSGPGNYWVNGQGEYFRTEDQLYDPRRDNSLNHHQWTQFEVMK